MTERKSGFVYLYSEILKQEIAWSMETGVVYCKDKVRYNPLELEIINGVLPLEVHLVKKVFENSEVVKNERVGTKNAGTADKTGNGKSQYNAGCPAGKVASVPGNGAENESATLELY
jgi:hypothetical protein